MNEPAVRLGNIRLEVEIFSIDEFIGAMMFRYLERVSPVRLGVGDVCGEPLALDVKYPELLRDVAAIIITLGDL